MIVVCNRTPFKVLHTIIGLVLILMIDTRQIIRIGDKSQCDKSMSRHEKSSPVII